LNNWFVINIIDISPYLSLNLNHWNLDDIWTTQYAIFCVCVIKQTSRVFKNRGPKTATGQNIAAPLPMPMLKHRRNGLRICQKSCIMFTSGRSKMKPQCDAYHKKWQTFLLGDGGAPYWTGNLVLGKRILMKLYLNWVKYIHFVMIYKSMSYIEKYENNSEMK